jgi:hypothetical protein
MEFPMPSNTYRFYNISNGSITEKIADFRDDHNLTDARFQKFYDMMQSKRDIAAKSGLPREQISFVVKEDGYSPSGYRIKALPDKEAALSFLKYWPNYGSQPG